MQPRVQLPHSNFAGRSTNSSDRPCQFSPADACVRPAYPRPTVHTSCPLRTSPYDKEVLSKHRINHVSSSRRPLLFLDMKGARFENVELAHHAFLPARPHSGFTERSQVSEGNSSTRNFLFPRSRNRGIAP